MQATHLLALGAAALLSAPLSAGDLFVGPSAAFQEIQPAIDAASAGDVIHVAPGAYDVFTLTKPLAIVGAGSAQVVVRDDDGALGVSVAGIPAGGEATLSGFELGATVIPSVSKFHPPRLSVHDCAGRVAIHDVIADTGAAASYSPRILDVVDSDQVLVTRSRLIGSSVSPGSQIPVRAENADVWISECGLRGGDGVALTTSPNPHDLTVGAPGLWLVGSTAEVSGSVVAGGRAGAQALSFSLFVFPDAGGPGILMFDSSVTLGGGPGNAVLGGDAPPPLPPGSGLVYAPAPAPGGSALHSQNGLFGFPLQSDAVVAADVVLVSGVDENGVASQLTTGDVFFVAEPTRRPTLRASELQHPLGAASSLSLFGEPLATHAVAYAAAGADPLALAGFAGSLMLPPSAVWPVGATALDAGGSATLPVAVPALAALSGVRVWLQSVQLGTTSSAFSIPTLFVIAP